MATNSVCDASKMIIKEGNMVQIVHPDLKTKDWGNWRVQNIFINEGQYPTLPIGPTVRLFRIFCERWVLPLSNVRLANTRGWGRMRMM